MQAQQQPPQQPPLQPYPGAYPSATSPVGGPTYHIPQPINAGSVDLSNIKPVHSGSVSLSDAVARARGIAAEKGISYDSRGRNGSTFEFRYCPLFLVVSEVSVLTIV